MRAIELLERAGFMPAPSTANWSFVTVTYNNSAVLKEFWANLPWPDNVEWIVVDNASTDDSVDVAEHLGARVIKMPTNCGFSAANNVGFDHSSAPYVAFVNPDVTVDFDSLGHLAETLNQKNAIIAPQLINADGTLQPNGRGWPFLLHKIQHRLNPQAVQDTYRLLARDDETVNVAWVTGAVVAGTRETFLRLGPWDSKFFLYHEDADLCLRARRLGIETLVCGSARWIHGWQRATSGFNFEPWKRELASMSKFYLRYPSLLSPFPNLTTRRIERKDVVCA